MQTEYVANNEHLIELYAEFKLHNKGAAQSTVQKYSGHLRRLAGWLQLQHLDLSTANSDHLEKFTGIEAHRLKMGPKTRRTLVAAVRDFYKWADIKKVTTGNPAKDLPYPQTGNKLPVPMALDNMEKIMQQPDLDSLKGIRDIAVMSVLAGTGLRIAGLVNLNQSSLQFANYLGKEHLFIKVLEKGNNERIVPAPHETRLLLKAYLGHHELEPIDRTLPNSDHVLFVSLRNRNIPPHEYHGENRRISERSIRESIVIYAEAAGIPRDQAHPHAFRHLYGTELLEGDVDLRVIQSLLGHKDVSTTQKYVQVAMRKLTTAVNAGNPLGKINTPVTALLKQLEAMDKQ